MSKNLIIILIVLAVLISGGWFVLKSQKTQDTTQVTPTQSLPEAINSPVSSSSASATIKESIVTITAAGFNPKDLKIKVGESVTWVNNDTKDHNVASAPHPTHTVYPPLNLGVAEAGEKKSLVFPTPGTYKYHDHLNPSLFGSVTVE